VRRQLTHAMPFFAKEFGLLPWHFGGDPWLTYDEIKEFVETTEEIITERQRVEAEMNRRR